MLSDFVVYYDLQEEVKEELSADELFEKKKAQLAELGMALLEDPESNIRSLNDLLIICNDMDQKVVKLGIMSLLAVFRDIIPRYVTVHFSYHLCYNVPK